MVGIPGTIVSNHCEWVRITVLVRLEIINRSFDAIGTKIETEIGSETEITRSAMAFAFTTAPISTDDRNAGARAQISGILLQQETGAIASHRFEYSAALPSSLIATLGSVAKASLSIATFLILRNSQREVCAIGTGRFHRCRLKMSVAFQGEGAAMTGLGDNFGRPFPKGYSFMVW